MLGGGGESNLFIENPLSSPARPLRRSPTKDRPFHTKWKSQAAIVEQEHEIRSLTYKLANAEAEISKVKRDWDIEKEKLTMRFSLQLGKMEDAVANLREQLMRETGARKHFEAEIERVRRDTRNEVTHSGNLQHHKIISDLRYRLDDSQRQYGFEVKERRKLGARIAELERDIVLYEEKLEVVKSEHAAEVEELRASVSRSDKAERMARRTSMVNLVRLHATLNILARQRRKYIQADQEWRDKVASLEGQEAVRARLESETKRLEVALTKERTDKEKLNAEIGRLQMEIADLKRKRQTDKILIRSARNLTVDVAPDEENSGRHRSTTDSVLSPPKSSQRSLSPSLSRADTSPTSRSRHFNDVSPKQSPRQSPSRSPTLSPTRSPSRSPRVMRSSPRGSLRSKSSQEDV